MVGNDAVRILSKEESTKVQKKLKSVGKQERVVCGRLVSTDRSDGLRTDSYDLPLEAIAGPVVAGYKVKELGGHDPAGRSHRLEKQSASPVHPGGLSPELAICQVRRESGVPQGGRISRWRRETRHVGARSSSAVPAIGPKPTGAGLATDGPGRSLLDLLEDRRHC